MMKYIFFFLLVSASNIFAFSSKEEIASIFQNTKDHLDKKIEKAKVEIYPFPHIIIEDIFPDHIYEKIQNNWPSSDEFIGNGPRAILPVTNGCLECTKLTTPQKVFWHVFGETIVNRYIKPKLIFKLSPYINWKYKLENFEYENLNYLQDFTNLRQDCLVQDRSDYCIPSHIDQLNIFAAVILYLPADYDHQDFGTHLLEGSPCEDPNAIYHGQNWKLGKKIPYRPNTLLCFLQSPYSWHRVESTVASKYIRKIYIGPIFLSPEFIQTHYKGIYNRSIEDEYFFDHRFLSRNNWWDIWSHDDHYK